MQRVERNIILTLELESRRSIRRTTLEVVPPKATATEAVEEAGATTGQGVMTIVEILIIMWLAILLTNGGSKARIGSTLIIVSGEITRKAVTITSLITIMLRKTITRVQAVATTWAMSTITIIQTTNPTEEAKEGLAWLEAERKLQVGEAVRRQTCKFLPFF
jgi:hypothetical protein